MPTEADVEIAKFLSTCRKDPLRYVMGAFPWKTDKSIQVVPLQEPYKSRFPEHKYGPDKWQCEFLEQWGEEIRKRGFNGRDPVSPIRFSTVSGHGVGKAQPLNLVVPTPNGDRRWGDIKPGDYLWGLDGQPTRVIATHYHSKLPLYRISFNDGSSTIACGDHLWLVKGRQQRRRGLDWITLSTEQIAKLGVKRPNGLSQARQWEIPRIQPVQIPAREVSVAPYTLGAWLGDGGRLTSIIHTPDEEVINQLEKITKISRVKGCFRCHVANLAPRLRKLGIEHLYSYERYIPDIYKYNSVEVRLEVLRGLLDADGEVSKSGTIVYSSSSERLVEDVIWLVRSLGGKASKQAVKRTTHRNCYRCTLILPYGMTPFYTKRRFERLNPRPQERYLKRWIDRIEPIGVGDAMCVTVDAADSIYLTNDFIPTHNSTLAAWIVKFILDTRPFSVGTVTANTAPQLRTKTWAEVGKWHNMSITKHWFVYTSSTNTMSLVHADKELAQRWKCFALTCNPNNSESFAGQHASNSTSFYIFDEASKIEDILFEVREGGLASGEPMVFDFGNGTRNSGRFYENCVGRFSKYYITRSIDSREAYRVNKESIEQDIELYGIDDDFVKVRWLGQFPDKGSVQFISSEAVREAQRRQVASDKDTDPVVIGVDVARFGDDSSVIYARWGYDARSFPPRVYRGLNTIQLATKVSEFYDELSQLGLQPAAVFVDGGGGYGGGVVDQLEAMRVPVIEVLPGSKAINDITYRLRMDEMWGNMRDALDKLALPASDTDVGKRLFDELTQREYGYTQKEQVKLESKEDMKARGLPSPDIADALALTFAQPIHATASAGASVISLPDYDPFST